MPICSPTCSVGCIDQADLEVVFDEVENRVEFLAVFVNKELRLLD